jgi:hypothetical protein
MYRVRSQSGEEAVYRTIDELALAVQSGVIGPGSEVYHQTTDRWLPIDAHPDYRAVVAGDVVVAPKPDGALDSLPEPSAEPGVPNAAGDRAEVTSAGALPEPNLQLETYRPRVSKLRIMLAITGATLLVAGTYGLRTSWPGIAEWMRARAERARTAGMSPPRASATGLGDSAAAAASDSQSEPQALARELEEAIRRTSPPDRPAGPARRARQPSYFEAYADARAELDGNLDYVGFRAVFSPSHFTEADSLRAARRMVRAAGNIVRSYHEREVILEQSYRRDSVGDARSLRESFEAAEAEHLLLSQADSLFGLLLASPGHYQYRDGSVRLSDPALRGPYLSLRDSILSRVASWRDSGETPSRIVMPRLLRAFDLAPPALAN